MSPLSFIIFFSMIMIPFFWALSRTLPKVCKSMTYPQSFSSCVFFMKKIKLYDYQQEMLENIINVLSANSLQIIHVKGKKVRLGNSVMVQMPTGTGKTVVMGAVIKWFLDNHDEGEVWLIAHRRELVEQMQQTLDRFCLKYGEKSDLLRAKVRIRLMSIQWLNRHQKEMEHVPGLIVVDEAHHAIADSYQNVFENYRSALKMGMTATPCRLAKASFTRLFYRLLTSPPTKDFIRRGNLAPYDYVCVGKFSTDQLTVNLLKGRGSDGDYAIKEMDEKLNIPQTIQRLYDSVAKYAEGKKGIVFAIDIAHAQAIAKCYNALGIKAVALDSKTPAKTRRDMVEAFRKGELDCMVNVNLFDEGFDCPDVEYIQMARPTLSLAKYLQMVGRGLRINREQKDKVCMIIDNVGNYRKFGLPDKERDWIPMFTGLRPGKGVIPTYAKKANAVTAVNNDMVFVAQTSKEKVEQTRRQRIRYLQDVKPYEEGGRWGLRVGEDIILRPIYYKIHDFVGGFAVFEIGPGKCGILIRNGKVYYPAEFKEIELLPNNKAQVKMNALRTVEVQLDAKWGY